MKSWIMHETGLLSFSAHGFFSLQMDFSENLHAASQNGSDPFRSYVAQLAQDMCWWTATCQGNVLAFLHLRQKGHEQMDRCTRIKPSTCVLPDSFGTKKQATPVHLTCRRHSEAVQTGRTASESLLQVPFAFILVKVVWCFTSHSQKDFLKGTKGKNSVSVVFVASPRMCLCWKSLTWSLNNNEALPRHYLDE